MTNSFALGKFYHNIVSPLTPSTLFAEILTKIANSQDTLNDYEAHIEQDNILSLRIKQELVGSKAYNSAIPISKQLNFLGTIKLRNILLNNSLIKLNQRLKDLFSDIKEIPNTQINLEYAFKAEYFHSQLNFPEARIGDALVAGYFLDALKIVSHYNCNFVFTEEEFKKFGLRPKERAEFGAFLFAEYWKNCRLTIVLASILSKSAPLAFESQLFSFCSLYNVGHLLTYIFDFEATKMQWGAHKLKQSSFHNLETKENEMNHGSLAALLLSKFDYFQVTSELIEFHHDSKVILLDSPNNYSSVILVRLASALAFKFKPLTSAQIKGYFLNDNIVREELLKIGAEKNEVEAILQYFGYDEYQSIKEQYLALTLNLPQTDT